MKKYLLVFVILALVATGVFAQVSLSAGGGLIFDWSFNNGLKLGGNKEAVRMLSIGGFGFFDATYVEADVYFAYGKNTWYYKGGGSSGTDDGGSMIQLGFSLLGKYPFELGSITLFPLLGINYNVVLNAWDPDGNSVTPGGESAVKWLSQFGILGGVGLDFDITDSLYLRGEALLHLRLPMKLMSDMAGGSVKATLGVGPVIKVALGYKF